MSGRSKKGIVFILILGAVLMSLFNYGLKATNTTEFCTSCHSMQNNLAELKETVHYSSASGVHAGCPDCHVPKAFIPKMIAKVMAVKDVYHEILGTIDTPEKFEKHRWAMANRVWAKMKATNSRECRTCHSFDRMNLEEQSKSARKRHAAAEKKGKTCIDCHKGIAHEDPDEPDDAPEEVAKES
ncbi:MAG: cytochrome C [Aquificaceae bacterium]|nr:MAG: cytochrome C [Aquificaceae bacterium]